MQTSALLKRYTVMTAITLVAIIVIGYLLEAVAGLSIGSGVSVVGALVPAMDAGQTYARQTKAMPDKGYMWKMAALFVPINVAVSAVLMGVTFAILGGMSDMLALFAELGAVTYVIFAVVFLLYWLMGRFFMGFGAKNELKMQARLAAKEQTPTQP